MWSLPGFSKFWPLRGLGKPLVYECFDYIITILNVLEYDSMEQNVLYSGYNLTEEWICDCLQKQDAYIDRPFGLDSTILKVESKILHDFLSVWPAVYDAEVWPNNQTIIFARFIQA